MTLEIRPATLCLLCSVLVPLVVASGHDESHRQYMCSTPLCPACQPTCPSGERQLLFSTAAGKRRAAAWPGYDRVSAYCGEWESQPAHGGLPEYYDKCEDPRYGLACMNPPLGCYEASYRDGSPQKYRNNEYSSADYDFVNAGVPFKDSESNCYDDSLFRYGYECENPSVSYFDSIDISAENYVGNRNDHDPRHFPPWSDQPNSAIYGINGPSSYHHLQSASTIKNNDAPIDSLSSSLQSGQYTEHILLGPVNSAVSIQLPLDQNCIPSSQKYVETQDPAVQSDAAAMKGEPRAPIGKCPGKDYNNIIVREGESCIIIDQEHSVSIFPEIHGTNKEPSKSKARHVYDFLRFVHLDEHYRECSYDSAVFYAVLFDLRKEIFTSEIRHPPKYPLGQDEYILQLKRLITAANQKYPELTAMPIGTNAPDHCIIFNAALLIALLELGWNGEMPAWNDEAIKSESARNRFIALKIACLFSSYCDVAFSGRYRDGEKIYEHLIKRLTAHVGPLPFPNSFDLMSGDGCGQPSWQGSGHDLPRSNGADDASDPLSLVLMSAPSADEQSKKIYRNAISKTDCTCIILSRDQCRNLFPERYSTAKNKLRNDIAFVYSRVQFVPLASSGEECPEKRSKFCAILFSLSQTLFSQKTSSLFIYPRKLPKMINRLRALIAKANVEYSELQKEPIKVNAPDHCIIFNASLLIALLEMGWNGEMPAWCEEHAGSEVPENRLVALIVASVLSRCEGRRYRSVSSDQNCIYRHLIERLEENLGK